MNESNEHVLEEFMNVPPPTDDGKGDGWYPDCAGAP